METRIFRVGQMLFWPFHLLLVFAVISVHRVEAQPSGADTVRFLEQSTFGPTPSIGGVTIGIGVRVRSSVTNASTARVWEADSSLGGAAATSALPAGAARCWYW